MVTRQTGAPRPEITRLSSSRRDLQSVTALAMTKHSRDYGRGPGMELWRRPLLVGRFAQLGRPAMVGAGRRLGGAGMPGTRTTRFVLAQRLPAGPASARTTESR